MCIRDRPGTVLTCRVTRLESFGAFVDIGCGIVAMLPVERISVSRIAHPAQRFREGERILAAVWSVDLSLIHLWLLVTVRSEWTQIGAQRHPGLRLALSPSSVLMFMSSSHSHLAAPQSGISVSQHLSLIHISPASANRRSTVPKSRSSSWPRAKSPCKTRR